MTKILLVEDNKFLRLATERARVRAGYGVYTAIAGEHDRQAARGEEAGLDPARHAFAQSDRADVLKALKRDPATAPIAGVAWTGLSHNNAPRLEQDGAIAFGEKSELTLDNGCDAWLAALAEIVKKP